MSWMTQSFSVACRLWQLGNLASYVQIEEVSMIEILGFTYGTVQQ